MRRSDWVFLLVLVFTVAAVAGALYFSETDAERGRRLEAVGTGGQPGTPAGETALRFRPFCTTVMIRTPISVLKTCPRPPERLEPPTTT